MNRVQLISGVARPRSGDRRLERELCALEVELEQLRESHIMIAMRANARKRRYRPGLSFAHHGAQKKRSMRQNSSD
jgi:hypothetical protein